MKQIYKKRKQNPALYDNRNDSHQSAVWNTMGGIAEKCSGMVGQYLSGVLFFRMGSVWLRCPKNFHQNRGQRYPFWLAKAIERW